MRADFRIRNANFCITGMQKQAETLEVVSYICKKSQQRADFQGKVTLDAALFSSAGLFAPVLMQGPTATIVQQFWQLDES